MNLIDLLALGLATWRMSRMLVNEEGPGRVFVHIRKASGIMHDDMDFVCGKSNDWTPLLCVYCTSIWAAPIALLCNKAPLGRLLVHVLAVSAVAVLIEEHHGNS